MVDGRTGKVGLEAQGFSDIIRPNMSPWIKKARGCKEIQTH